VCSKAGDATEVLKVTATPIPAALEWGEVMVSVRAAPISPADIYTARLGGEFGDEAVVTPYTAGHDGVGLVQKVSLPIPFRASRCYVFQIAAS
jgi:trans-2-enoyl-CoA reductase